METLIYFKLNKKYIFQFKEMFHNYCKKRTQKKLKEFFTYQKCNIKSTTNHMFCVLQYFYFALRVQSHILYAKKKNFLI